MPPLILALVLIIGPAHSQSIPGAGQDWHGRLGILVDLTPADLPALELRATNGEGNAMVLMGEAYGLGFGGLRQDDGRAAEWLDRAVASGQGWAGREAGFFRFRARHEDDISLAQGIITRARERAESDDAPQGTPDPELEALARAGVRDAQAALGAQLLAGHGAGKDPIQAARWLSLAARQGDAGSSYALGRMFELGVGVPVDLQAAADNMLQAARCGNTKAQAAMGAIYLDGSHGTAQDTVEAVKWLALAGAAGDIVARDALVAMSGLEPAQVMEEGFRRARGWSPSPG